MQIDKQCEICNATPSTLHQAPQAMCSALPKEPNNNAVSKATQHGLSDHGFSDNTSHSTLFAWSCQISIYHMYFTTFYPAFYHGLSDNMGHPISFYWSQT